MTDCDHDWHRETVWLMTQAGDAVPDPECWVESCGKCGEVELRYEESG